MSQENVELLRRALEEWNRGERSEARVRAFWHSDVEFLPRRSATEGPYRGIDGVERFIADTDETFAPTPAAGFPGYFFSSGYG
jgi:hypothetical protein